ncbi:hypothetical protein Tco_1432461 [Tanacetum coccineum]
MVSTMTTRNVGRRIAATRGGETSEQDGREGKRSGDQAGSGDNVINDNNQGNVRTVNMNNGQSSCLYKEFMACNPKDYNGNGGAIVYTRCIEKMESVQDMSRCGENQKVKYTADSFIDFNTLTRDEFCPNNKMQKLETEFWFHAMVGASHPAYTDRFHELARLVPHLVTPENKIIERYIYGIILQTSGIVAVSEPKTIQSAILKAKMITDEAIRNGALNKNTKKRGDNGEPGRDGNVKDDNKRSRTRRVFATITNPVRKEYTGTLLMGRVLNFVVLIFGRAFVIGAEEAR